MSDNKLMISFPDQSKSFTYGVEFGRILEKMERGDDHISNSGFPVRIENREVICNACNTLGYTPRFGVKYYNEYVAFSAVKKEINN